MPDDDIKRPGPPLLKYVACYASWIGFSALGFWIVWQLRYDVVALAVRLRLSRRAVIAADKWSTILLGLLWLIGIILLEDYLRKGVDGDRLGARAFRAFLFGIIALGMAYGLRLLLT